MLYDPGFMYHFKNRTLWGENWFNQTIRRVGPYSKHLKLTREEQDWGAKLVQAVSNALTVVRSKFYPPGGHF